MPPFNHFTTKAKEAIRRAHELAIERGQNHVSTLHLLGALLTQEESMVISILDKLDVDKILLTQAMQLVRDIEREIDPVAFALEDGEQAESERGDWFYTRAASIYGGAIDVQRGIVAERVLGLPRSAR